MESLKLNKVIKLLLSIAYLVNIMATAVLIFNSHSSYFLGVFSLAVLFISIIEQYEKINNKIMYAIVLCLIIFLPTTVSLMLSSQTIFNWFVTFDKELFYFLYYKKVNMSLLLLPLILFDSVLIKLFHKLKFKFFISFVLTLLLLIIYNQIDF